MQSKALHGCIQYIKERATGVEQARTFDIALGIDSKLRPLDSETLDTVIERVRTYDTIYGVEIEDDYTDEDIEGDNLALQEPDIFL